MQFYISCISGICSACCVNLCRNSNRLPSYLSSLFLDAVNIVLGAIRHLWSSYRGEPRSRVLPQLILILGEEVSSRNYYDRLVAGSCRGDEFQSRACCSAVTFVRPFACCRRENESHRLEVAISSFKSNLVEYARSIETHGQNFSNQMQLWVGGGLADAESLLSAQYTLFHLREEFSSLLREGQLSWAVIKQRYADAEYLVGDLSNFQVFQEAYTIYNDWDALIRFKNGVTPFPITALHELLEMFQAQEKELSEEAQEAWKTFCQQIKSVNAAFFHRAITTAIRYSRKVPLDQVAMTVGRVVNWLDRSFELPFLHLDDIRWQAQIQNVRARQGSLLFSKPIESELGDCHIYKESGAEADLIIPWKNALALCQLAASSRFNFGLKSIEPTGLRGEIVQTFPIASNEGRRLLREETLVDAIRTAVSEEKMAFDLSQALRVSVRGEVVWRFDLNRAVPFNPLVIEMFLVRLSPEKSHEWMRESGAGGCEEAKRYRENVLKIHQNKFMPEVEEKLEQRVVQLLATLNRPRSNHQAALSWLREKVKFRWLSDHGLIAKLTDSFLAQFDEAVQDKFPLIPSSAPSTSTPSSSRMEREGGFFD